MKINTLEELQEFIRENWSNINNEEFTKIIQGAFKVLPLFRRNTASEEITAYMNEWIKNPSSAYGTELNREFSIKDLFKADGSEVDGLALSFIN